MKKSDIEFHYDHGRKNPAINVKWHFWLYDPEFVGMWRNACVEHGLPDGLELEGMFSDGDFQDIWDMVAEQQWDDAKADVVNLYSSEMGRKVEVWQEGRSGGWMTVHNLPDVECWDAIMVSRWGRVTKIVKSYLDDCDYQLAWQLANEISERASTFV